MRTQRNKNSPAYKAPPAESDDALDRLVASVMRMQPRKQIVAAMNGSIGLECGHEGKMPGAQVGGWVICRRCDGDPVKLGF